MIVRARFVVSMDGPPAENGGVVVQGDRIVAVGEFEHLRRLHDGEVLDLGDRALLPGLVNAHCHLDYTCLRGKIPAQKSFADWILAINAAKARLTPQDYADSITAGAAESLRFGTTSMVNLTAFPDLIKSVRSDLRIWWAPELIDVRAPENAPGLVRGAMNALRSSTRRGLAPHAPYTASAPLYHLCQDEDLLLTTHLAESREEAQMFSAGRGQLFDFIRSINASLPSFGQSPLSYFLTNLDRGRPWLIAHLNELTDDDFALLERQVPNFIIAHCPRSHEFFGHTLFQFDRLRGNFPVCLGTDSLASNTDLNLFAEMRHFGAAVPNTNPEEVLAMVTRRAGLNGVGQLRPDFYADMIAVPVGPDRESLFDQIIAFEGEPWVMASGNAGTL